jgi:hypothetical protein
MPTVLDYTMQMVPRLFGRRAVSCLLAMLAPACVVRDDACGGCPGQESCLEFQLVDGGLAVQCGTLSQSLGPCGLSIPAACADTSLTCVLLNPPNGVCFPLCDPTNPACTAGLSCLAVLAIPDAGICAQPAPSGTTCNQSQQLFCPMGQVCEAGTCLKRCDPTKENDCPQLESCVTPFHFDPGLSICTQPQPLGSTCSVENNAYCDNDAFCVSIADAGSRCLKDCTDGGLCPPTQVCRPISYDMMIVAGACF